MTLSMLKGEQGNQAKELERLVDWLAAHGAGPGDWVCLSNVLLVGLARALKTRLGVKVACTLQGEDTFLDAMPEPYRSDSWAELIRRVADVDVLIAVSSYYRDVMLRRLSLPTTRVRVAWNGINLDGYEEAAPQRPPVLGYFARMCRDKGLHTLVDAFILLAGQTGARLSIGGTVTAADEEFVETQKEKLRAAGLEDRASFHPNVDRAQKLQLLRELTVFSVPATYGEAFGLYVLEGMAAGVPVVAPRHGAFPELISATSGGVLCAPDDPRALADAIIDLLSDETRRLALGHAGRESVRARFSATRMAADFLAALEVTAATA
jgi:glycosyltransferase involved in cell wall biosynthesis